MSIVCQHDIQITQLKKSNVVCREDIQNLKKYESWKRRKSMSDVVTIFILRKSQFCQLDKVERWSKVICRDDFQIAIVECFAVTAFKITKLKKVICWMSWRHLQCKCQMLCQQLLSSLVAIMGISKQTGINKRMCNKWHNKYKQCI